MPKNVIITPASGLVDFYDLNSNLDAKIQIDDPGNLSITNSGGTLTLGNTAANIYIGDGTNSVDVIFEQNGAIRALTGKTLTLGNSASSVAVQSPIYINSPILNTSTTGDFEIRQTVSTWTNSTSHPIIKWTYNVTYDDNLYLASGGNAGGTTQTALVVTETAGVVIGIPNANPNSTSVLSTEWFRFDVSRFTITRNATQYITFENSDTTTTPIITSYTSASNAKPIYFDSRTDVAGAAVTAGTLGYEFRVNGTSALTINTDRTISTNTGFTVGGALSVTGNLTVNGTTTTVNSTTVTIDDPIFTLGGDTAPTVDDNKDRGIEFRWHNGTSAKIGFFGYDDSTGYLTFIPDATNTSEVFSGTQGDIQATNFRGALVGNATTASAWQTARTVTIGSTGKSVDGSANVSWTLAEIGAYAATNPSGYTTNTGTVTSVGGTGTVSGLTLTGTVTTTGNLTLGGTLAVAASNFASQTANTFLSAPNGAAGVPTFRTIVAADIPTLNQSTTGNAATATAASVGNVLRFSDATSWVGGTTSIGTSGSRSVDLAPNTYGQTIAAEFKNSSLYGFTGTYTGLVTVAPWVGTTASTGDPSYQLAFHPSAANSTTNPTIRVRAGIDTTWGAWNILLHSTNYNSYSPTLTGTGASGSWGISVTGTSANVTGTVAIANGGTGATTNTAARTNLGATTLGANLFTITNPSAVTFPRFNADNTVSSLDAATFRTAIGASVVTVSNDTTTNADTFYPSLTSNQTTGTLASAVVSSTKLYFNPSTGQLNATNFNSLSDVTKKENVATIENATQKMVALRGVTFDWVETKKPSMGVIAQEVEEVVPEVVSTSSTGEKSVNYNALVGLLIQTVKEQNTRIEQLERLINTLTTNK